MCCRQNAQTFVGADLETRHPRADATCAAIGLGGVFLHLDAELNFHRLFEEEIEGFSLERVGDRQQAALARAGLR